MKQNPGFTLKEFSGVPYLLPFGQMIASHKRGLKTNATGIYVWNLLETEHSLSEVLSLSASHYHISEEELPEFTEDITRFVNQLIRYGVLLETETTDSDFITVVDKLKSSRAAAKEIFPGIFSNQNVLKHLLSIGGLTLKLTCPKEAFPPDFSDFVITEASTDTTPVQLEITLFSKLPEPETLPTEPDAALLLQNYELNILETADYYLLHFPTAKHHLEIHLAKDGSCAHCYSLPPYDDKFHYDFFHALRLVYLYLAQKHGMAALHSASILYQDRLWLFSGHSGMGKSTHTNLWKEHFSTPVINGDLNLLAMENAVPVVHGIPWCGTSGIYDTRTYPLGGIILINRAETNYTEELTEDEKQLLVSQRLISPSWTKELWEKNMEIVEQVTRDILVCRLYCTKERDAAEVMKEYIDKHLSKKE